MSSDKQHQAGYPCTVSYDIEARSKWLVPAVPLAEYAERHWRQAFDAIMTGYLARASQ
jgi:pyridoxal/pyridoxine/pyridoxamine kinase